MRLTSSTDSDVPSLPVDFELKDFDGQVAHLQLNYDGVDTSVYDDVEVTIRAEAEEITSISGKHIKTDSIDDFKMAPLVDQSTAKRM